MKKTNKAISILLSIVFIISILPSTVYGLGKLYSDGPTEIPSPMSGTCGANVNWTLDTMGTLTISGIGSTGSYIDPYSD